MCTRVIGPSSIRTRKRKLCDRKIIVILSFLLAAVLKCPDKRNLRKDLFELTAQGTSPSRWEHQGSGSLKQLATSLPHPQYETGVDTCMLCSARCLHFICPGIPFPEKATTTIKMGSPPSVNTRWCPTAMPRGSTSSLF